MIKLKHRPNAPDTLTSQKVDISKKKIEQKVSSGLKPVSDDFPKHWLPEARRILYDHQNHKCCYCEREREGKRESDLEHFRPKAGIEEDHSHFGYWWLAYKWDNYLFSCKPCNQGYKKNQFPLLADGTRASIPSDTLNNENPVLINPYDEDPEKFISFDWEDSNGLFVKAVGTSIDIEERGKRTIEIVGLNRPGLPEERAGFLLNLQGITAKMYAGQYLGEKILIKEAAKDIKRETSSKKPFAGFRRAYFRKVGLGQFISKV